MTVRFANRRLGFYVVVFLLSATVLGLSAHLAKLFLPHYHKDLTIFSLVVTSVTIFAFLLTVQWSSPRIEAGMLFLLGALWLAMGAWSTDVIGHVQCDGLSSSTPEPTSSGSISIRGYCYEMKVIQAFSWMLFVLFCIALIILSALVSQAQNFGRINIWEEPIRELPWFGEAPGYYNSHLQTPMAQYPAGYPAYGYPGGGGTPGHSIIVQPGVNGQPTTVTQVPMQA